MNVGYHSYVKAVTTPRVVAGLLFLIIMGVLALPYSGFSFIHDDYMSLGLFNSTPISEWHRFFSDRCLNYGLGESGADFSFLTVMFRPLYQIFVHIKCLLIGPHAYAHIILSVAIHAVTALMFFTLLTMITSTASAFLWALAFGVHASLGDWMGQLGCDQYSLDLIVFFSMMLLMKKYWDSHDRTAYALSLLLLFLQLFIRETLIVAPACMFLLSATYLYYCKQRGFGRFSEWFSLWLTCVPYGFSVIAYLLVRLYFFPYKPAQAGAHIYLDFETLFNIKRKFYVYVSTIVDSFGLGWIPAGHTLFKCTLLAGLLGVLLVLIARNRYWLAMVSLLGCSLFLIWPCFLVVHEMRYVYAGLPFLMTAFVLGFIGYLPVKSTCFNRFVKALSYVIPVFLIISGIGFNTLFLRARESRTQQIKQGFIQLLNDYDCGEREILFVGAPAEIVCGHGAGPALSLYSGRTISVHNEWSLGSHYALHMNNIAACYPPATNYVTITQMPHGVMLKSTDPEKVWFELPLRREADAAQDPFKEIVVNGTKCSQFTYYFLGKLSKSSFDCYGWDFEQRKFFFIGTVHNGLWHTE